MVLAGKQTEVTATKVWNQLRGKTSVPAFWNIFPFHPWEPGNPAKNRKPTLSESLVGLPYVDALVNILQPHTVVAVGGVANSLLQVRYPQLKYSAFSHPSMGGYPGFVTGFSRLALL